MIKRTYNRVVDFWWGNGLAYEAPALAFYLLVSLAPLALGLAALAGILFADSLEPARVADAVAERFPQEVGERIIKLAGSAQQQTLALLLSIWLMIWTSSSALGVLERAMTRVSGGPGFGLFSGRIRLIGFGAAFSLLLIFALALSSRASGHLPFDGAAFFLAAALLYGGCCLIYWSLPRRRPSRTRLFSGAFVGAFSLVASPYLVSLYLSLGRITFSGIFAFVAILLISTYLMAIGLLIGAGIAAGRPATSR